MYEVSLLSLSLPLSLFLSLKCHRSTMLCIFVLLMTMSYYFGKEEATLNIKENKINKIKENKINKIKDICIL